MSDAVSPLCKDCVHFTDPDGRCIRSRRTRVDLVRGEPCISGLTLSAWIERDTPAYRTVFFLWTIPTGYCGPEGVFFKEIER